MKLPHDYSNFLKKTRHYDVGELIEFIERFSSVESLIGMHNPVRELMPASFILDYTQKKYIYASSKVANIIDRPVSYFLDGGIEFGTSLWHKEDLNVYSQHVLTQNLKFLKETPADNHADFIFTCNYRVKNRKGDFKNIMQQSIFIKSADNGTPLAVMGFLFDISKFRNDRRIYHCIEQHNALNKTGSKEPLLDNIYFLDEKEQRLTRREIEILKYLSDDLNSEQIAARMNISKHTVDNHRRNLLRKTNSKSSVGLVRFAFTEGYI